MATVTRNASASPSDGGNHGNNPQQHYSLPTERHINYHSSIPIDPSNFPLKSIGDVVNFFRRSLEGIGSGGGSTGYGGEPDLTLLSIIAGYVELSLTTGDAATAAEKALSNPQTLANITLPLTPLLAPGIISAASSASSAIIKSNGIPFPIITYELVSGLYKKFQSILSVVGPLPKSTSNRQATREIIKKVSDVIWHSLIRSSYKDRAHLQNLYCYLSGNKLDCFGVALAVVAGCQMLGYRDVHLAISEDHAWVVFGTKFGSTECIEVTWHGKGSEDKRGQDITAGIESGSWLYLSGHAVVCDRSMEVAAIVSAINISMTTTSDCVEVADMQQKLLWMLYDMGHLTKYPMALGTLGELEEICATPKRISCEQLYKEAIHSARKYYHNHHVYPYTYQGNFYNRLLKYREAFAAWANAADVIRLYTYSCRDDEEIYKELLDIANEMIPHVMKTESSGHSARSILRDSEVFANLLRFYDGICQWEEDSLTPILHIGWAKPLVNNITKFDYDIRSQVVIKVPEDMDKNQTTTAEATVSSSTSKKFLLDDSERLMKEDAAATAASEAIKLENKFSVDVKMEHNTDGYNVNNNILKKDEKASLDAKKMDMIATTTTTTTLADITAACGEKILNPEFLLQGGGEPFTELNKKHSQQRQHEDKRNNEAAAAANGMQATRLKHEVLQEREVHSPASCSKKSICTTPTPSPPPLCGVYRDDIEPYEFMLKRPVITLYSQKMKGLKDLLLAEKLNTHAISLQVTAQSVASRKIRGIDKLGNQTTASTYATAHAASQQHSSSNNNALQTATSSSDVAASNASDNSGGGGGVGAGSAATSIAATRPKRSRRE